MTIFQVRSLYELDTFKTKNNQTKVKFKNLFDACDIKYSDFIRTTEQRHHLAVNHFWTDLMNKGFIYKSSYEGCF